MFDRRRTKSLSRSSQTCPMLDSEEVAGDPRRLVRFHHPSQSSSGGGYRNGAPPHGYDYWSERYHSRNGGGVYFPVEPQHHPHYHHHYYPQQPPPPDRSLMLKFTEAGRHEAQMRRSQPQHHYRSSESEWTPAAAAGPPRGYMEVSKKFPMFTGNWTCRERKQQSRPGILSRDEENNVFRRNERPQSIHSVPDRGIRSRSEANTRQVAFSSPQDRSPPHSGRSGSRSPSEGYHSSNTPTEDGTPYQIKIAVGESDPMGCLRSKIRHMSSISSDGRSDVLASKHLRKSCPDLDATRLDDTVEPVAAPRRRNRRAKNKMLEAAWRRKKIEDWTLDDVLLWLQCCKLDDVASLLIGYDLTGKDVLKWDHNCLTQLGITNTAKRVRLLDELARVKQCGQSSDSSDRESIQKPHHKTLFDIVRLTSFDQVIAIETPLTTRDITVTHGHLGCLQVTKVNGAMLALKENDCLLEINERPGEQFKSALMLTKLISDANGAPIRFVVLRRKKKDSAEDWNETSSGISSSP